MAIALAIVATPSSAFARIFGGGPVQAPIQKAVQKPIQAPPEIVLKAYCDPPCITYKHHRLLRCKFDPCQTAEIILQVTDPCTCCTVAVPVCVPCCCDDVPQVCSHAGAFGRHVVEYRWCCGFEIKVVIDRCGDLTVNYSGL
jgi:hypothetical protein